MREIPLTQGKVAVVDDEDYEEVSRYRWFANRGGRTWYAQTNVSRGGGRRTALQMHQVILRKDRCGRQIDHRNGDGLDNRRANLRYATRSEQQGNRRLSLNNKSGLKGVKQIKKSGGYIARIAVKRQMLYLGYFRTAEAAARAYDTAAREVFGEFACPNFPEDERVT